ncbi:MAG: DUF1569 domain-containing protein [Flavisolibacter sp.]
MKSVLDRSTREELTKRIETLNENSTALWGKMNIHQMLQHCILCEEMFLGRKKYKRALIGLLFGRIGLRNMLKDDRPLGRNAPTSTAFKIKGSDGDMSSDKMKWISLVDEYSRYDNDEFVHWFFGKMTKEQVGQFAYKHSDHHLRQFNK